MWTWVEDPEHLVNDFSPVVQCSCKAGSSRRRLVLIRPGQDLINELPDAGPACPDHTDCTPAGGSRYRDNSIRIRSWDFHGQAEPALLLLGRDNLDPTIAARSFALGPYVRLVGKGEVNDPSFPGRHGLKNDFCS